MEKIYRVENPSLETDEILLEETIFHNANGYIGVRGCLEEGCPKNIPSIRGSYINGFYDFARMEQAEKLCGLIEEKQTILNVADTQTIRLYVDGEPFSLFEGTVESNSRILNMEAGFTERKVVWVSPEGKKVQIECRRMTSFVRLPLFLMKYSVKALNFQGTVSIESVHSGEVENYYDPNDPRVAGERAQYLKPVRRHIKKGISKNLSEDILRAVFEEISEISLLESETVKSALRVCSAVSHRFELPCQVKTDENGHSVIKTITFDLKKDQEAVLYKYTVFSDSVRNADCSQEAISYLEEVLKVPVEELYEEQRCYLSDYWERAFLEIKGDEQLNEAVSYNMYELLQSVGKDRYCNVAAKGLSGEGYEGHYFWDTEMYIEPYFLLTTPEIVKNLISYRYTTLQWAKENAAALGHRKGALYPWRTIMGKECSGYFPSGSAAYHINGDIAYSIISYYLVTKDLEFIREKGMEIMVETARLWMDMGVWHEGTFRIHEVTGPDEYTCMVNNNYYTNVLAKYHLYWVGKFDELLDGQPFALKEELEEFKQASERMYLPYDAELGINPQDDSFLEKKVWDLAKTPKEKFPLLLHYHPLYLYRHQVCKQADTVLAHFILEDMQSMETIRKSFLYYEKITTHDSSLSTAVFSIVASRLGMEEKAYSYFGDSAKLDLFNTHNNTKDGIHTANMGGNYMAVVYGFGGVRIKETGLYLAPSLPKDWESYRFKIYYEGRRILVETAKSGCKLILEEGEPVKLHLYGKEYLLMDCIEQKKKYRAVIFDLDGVICYTDHYHYLAWKEIADKLGIHFDEEVNNRLRGVSRKESFDIILEKYEKTLSEKEKEEYIAQKNAVYVELLGEMSPSDLPLEVKDTLESLRNKGMKLAIGSSSKNAGKILDKLGLGTFFDAVSDGNCISRSKPDPEVFLKAAEYLGMDAADCLVVEDAAAGIQAAVAAGMDSAGLLEAAKEEGCTYALDSISDLVKIIK